ncbi:hypothetical protein BHM03_00029200, partial [Ensete ventricosum]
MDGTYWSVRLLVRGLPATGRFRQKLTVGGRLREKKGRRRGKKEKKKRGVPISLRHPRGTPSLPAGRQRPRAIVARGSQALFLPRKETERLPAWGERSRR